MCNGQCGGNCGKDNPKTVKELLNELSSDMTFAKFEDMKEQLARAIDNEKSIQFKDIEQIQREHTKLLKEIKESQTSFWDNVGANVVGDTLLGFFIRR